MPLVTLRYAQELEKFNNNPYSLATMRYRKQKYNAGKRNLAWRLDKEKTIDMIAESKTCAISGIPLMFEIGHPDVPSIDRKNSRHGYTKSNIQVTSARINIMKGEMDQDEFVKTCRQIMEFHDKNC